MSSAIVLHVLDRPNVSLKTNMYNHHRNNSFGSNKNDNKKATLFIITNTSHTGESTICNLLQRRADQLREYPGSEKFDTFELRVRVSGTESFPETPISLDEGIYPRSY